MIRDRKDFQVVAVENLTSRSGVSVVFVGALEIEVVAGRGNF
jgi:hypothetical protein